MKKNLIRLTSLVLLCLLIPFNTKLHAQADKKDIFVFGRNQDSKTLDPVLTADNIDIWILPNIYDQLVRLNPKDNKLEPDLAEKWDISADKATYTFTLRKGVVFSDGSPVKASDVKWSLDRARDTNNGIWAWSLDPIDSITTPDDSTVVIKLKTPSVTFLAPLAMFNASVTSQAYFTKVGADKFGQEPLGTGPYLLKSWDKGQSLVLERNPKYWEPGLPITDQIKFVNIPDDNTRVLQLQSGDIDAMEYLPLSRVGELKDDPNVTVQLIPSTFVQYLLPNNRVEPYNDKNVRLALYYATDRQALLKTITFGLGTIANSYMSPATPFYSKDVTAPEFDLAKAKEYLAKSKFPNGFTTTLTIVGDDQTDVQIATAVKEMYSKIGVTVNIEQVDQGTRSARYDKSDFQMMTSYWTDDMVDPDELTTYIAYFPASQSMQSGYNNADLNKLIEQARLESDLTKRAEDYKKIQQIFNDDAPIINLYYKPYVVGVSRKVKDLYQLPTGVYPMKLVYVEK